MSKLFKLSGEWVIFFNRISHKISAFYALSFLFAAGMLFLLTGYILHNSLREKDKDLLGNKFDEYARLLSSDGVAGLQIRFSKKTIPDAAKFIVRLQTPEGQTVFIHVPQSVEVVGKTMTLADLDEKLRANSEKAEWIDIDGNDYGDDLELLSRKVPSGEILQIGKDTEDREEFMKELIRSFLIGLIPVMGLVFLIGLIFSRELLRPIHWLTETVNKIRSGKSGERVPLKSSGDELNQLSVLFNEMQDQNEKLVRSMRETLDHVAHDLRTPIMRMQNASEGALKWANHGANNPVHEALIECQENSETILRMLNSIMDVTEAETGTMRLQLERIRVQELVQHILEIYRFIAEEKNISLKLEIEEDLSVEGDSGKLLQAFANIIDNAIKYSPENSIVTIAGLKDSELVIIDVMDQGPGIPDSEKERIWERLYRGDKSRSTRGLGLGLSFVRAIITAHKGRVEVINLPAGGTSFRIIFLSSSLK